ncbi:hypothetical protein APB26_31870 [Pseudomonas aeruginosa]|nr:hypothetical protein APB26_31870 [Pseudomonas aeruginosa]RPV61256.1 hypothetical protein IPC838_18200 [Pseudomonas aeruginosa]
MLSSSLVWSLLAVCIVVLLPTLAIGIASLVAGRVTRMSFFTYASLGIVGVPLHELSHALACLLFRMRITKVALYAPDPDIGRLGYVAFAYNPRSTLHAVGLLVQGIAPLLMAGALLLWLVPAPHIDSIQVMGSVGAGWFGERITEGLSLGLAMTLGNLLTGLHGATWCSAALLIGAYGIPSWSDVRLALRGLVVVALVGTATVFLATSAETLLPSRFSADYFPWIAAVLSTATTNAIGFLITCATMVSLVGVAGVIVIQLLPSLLACSLKWGWQRLIRAKKNRPHGPVEV